MPWLHLHLMWLYSVLWFPPCRHVAGTMWAANLQHGCIELRGVTLSLSPCGNCVRPQGLHHGLRVQALQAAHA